MASKQLKLMNDLYASIKARVSKPGLDALRYLVEGRPFGRVVLTI